MRLTDLGRRGTVPAMAESKWVTVRVPEPLRGAFFKACKARKETVSKAVNRLIAADVPAPKKASPKSSNGARVGKRRS